MEGEIISASGERAAIGGYLPRRYSKFNNLE